MSTIDQQSAAPPSISFDGIFPLPLTPVESYMLLDATAEFPMMADLELLFQGQIDREAFEAALEIALARNPLFTCIVAPGKRGQLAWTPTELRPEIDWASLGTPIAGAYDRAADLTKELALRVFVRQGEFESTVLLHFHHAYADGMGGYALIEDLLAAYANCISPGSVRYRPLEPQRLARRGQVGVAGRSLYRQLTDPFVGIREAIKFFWQSPLPLPGRAARAREKQNSAKQTVTFLSQVCDEGTVDGLRRAASSAGVTVNDILLRDLFITLRREQAAGGPLATRRQLRILMPQNLRDPEDSAMPAANVLGFAFVTRSAELCDQPAQLLQDITAETKAVRRGRLSLYFVGGLAALQRSGLLGWVLRRDLCFSTAVLTNLSDPARRFVTRFPRVTGGLGIGNLTFVGMSGGPPLRPKTRASFSAFNSARSLKICVKCDSRHYSSLDAQRLLGDYVEQLRATAQAQHFASETLPRQ